MSKTWDQAQDDLAHQIARSFKELLETRHLYQRYEVKIEKIPDSELDGEVLGPIKRDIFESRVGEWCPLGFGQQKTGRLAVSNAPFTFTLSQIKIFCAECRSMEVHNPVRAEVASQHPTKVGFQVFVATFQCQACRRCVASFLIERQNKHLAVVGRTPMEHIVVPAFIPRCVQKFYSQAIVAYQTNYVLAGLFLLRTLIEQVARETTKSKAEQADQLMEEYMALLPQDFKDRFPSLRDIYGRLSVALHTADEAPELFQRCISEIGLHFEAVSLFEKLK